MSAIATVTHRPVKTVAATFQPVSVLDAKKQLELPSTTEHEPELRDTLIPTATDTVEFDTGLALCTSTWTYALDEWPSADYIDVPLRPVTAVTIAYLDADGNSQAWAAANFELDANRVSTVVHRAYNVSWPTVRTTFNAITLTLTAGALTQAAVPALHRTAVLLKLRELFYNLDGTAYENHLNRLKRATYP